MVLLPLDPFLNELTSMFERTTEKGSVWVTLKRSSLKSKVQRNKLATAGEAIEYRCLIRATDGKKTISTSNVRKDALESYCQVLGILDLGLGPIERLNRELVVTRVIRGRGVRGNRHGCLLQSLLGDYSLIGALALVGQKDHQRFQASYATILKAHMTALKKRERKDKKKSAEADKREGSSKKPKKS